MKTRGLWIVGVVVFVVTGLLHMPAALLYGWLKPHLGGAAIYGIEGKVGEGSALGFSLNGRSVTEQIQWQLKPWWLPLASVDAHLQGSGTAEINGDVRAAPGGRLRLSRFHVHGTLDTIATAAGIPLVPMTGIADLDLATLALRHGVPVTMEGTLEVQGLTWKFAASPIQLGNFRAAVTTEKDTVVAKIEPMGGPVGANGSVRITPKDKTYNLDLKVQPKPEADPALRELLQQLGPPDAQGNFLLHQHGILPL
jgi:hypothetical protein